MDKEIRISLSIFWDIALQGGNEVMRDLSNSFIYASKGLEEVFSEEVVSEEVVSEEVVSEEVVSVPVSFLKNPFAVPAFN